MGSTIKYRPEFSREPKKVHAPDIVPEVGDGQIDPTIGEETLDPEIENWINMRDEVYADIEEINSLYNEQVLIPMRIPVEDPVISEAISFLSNGDHDSYVSGKDWSNSHKILSNDSILKNAADYDLMEMLMPVIIEGVAEFLADRLKSIPAIGTQLHDALMSALEAQGGPKNDWGDLLRSEDLTEPLPISTILDVSGISHARKVAEFVNKDIHDPSPKNYNAAAASIYSPYLHSTNQWKQGVEVVDVLHGFRLYKTYDSTTTDMGAWAKKEGYDFIRPGADAYKYMRGRVMDSSFWKEGILYNRSIIKMVRNSMRRYLGTPDLACCLLNNLIGVGEVVSEDRIKFLKYLRMALMFSFNGLNIKTDAMLNSLIDILNALLAKSMSAVVSKLEEAMTDKVVKLRNYLIGYARSKGESWVRCYPFDELMQEALISLQRMEDTILSYLNDYTNLIKVSHVNFNEFSLQLKRRELIREHIGVLDAMIKGIETGIICKSLDGINKQYEEPTPEEILDFAKSGAFRQEHTIDDGVDKYDRTPSGEPLSSGGELSDKDRNWLQDCDKSMTPTELDILRRDIERIGTL